MIFLLTLLNILLFQSVLLCQVEPSFAEKVKSCYADEKFNDLLYSIEHEKDCFIGLKFSELQLSDINGKEISTIIFKDTVVLINFWFTACPPCIEEIPQLNQLQDQFKLRDFLLLSPSTDDNTTIKQFLKQFGELKGIIIPDALDLLRNTLASRSGFPTLFIIDKQGTIRHYSSGKISDFKPVEIFN